MFAKTRDFNVTAAAAIVLGALAAGAAAQDTVTISWNRHQNVSKLTATLQVVTNPLLDRDTLPHDSAFAAQARFNAGHVRFVPWYWFGDKYSIVEMKAPTATQTFWDFSVLDPQVEDFMSAQAGRPVIMNFSTVPSWIMKDTATAGELPYRRLGEYYARILSWYTKGGFTDELGVYHASGHHYKFDYWEAFNETGEPLEGSLSAAEYCRRYDTIVSYMRRVDSTVKFAGPASASGYYHAFYKYFMDPANHKPGIPIDMITYHWYGTTFNSYFQQVEFDLLNWTYAYKALRDRYRPNALINNDEMGTFSNMTTYPLTNSYWAYSGAVWAYGFAQMALAGADFATMSQLMAQPGNFPEVSMLDWTTGRPNARARVLELVRPEMGPGDSLVTAANKDSAVFVLPYITAAGLRKALVVNKSAGQKTVVFPHNVTAARYVDVTTNQNPAASSSPGTRTLVLNGYATLIATFAPEPLAFAPAPGTYSIGPATPVSVRLVPRVPQTALYYTTDGSTPTTASSLYSGPIPLTGTTTVKAIAAGDPTVMTATYVNGTPQLYNGGFETPALGAARYRYRAPGAGWNFISLAALSSNGSAFTTSSPAAPDSSQILILQNFGRAQQFVTMNAGTYTLSLRAAQRANFGVSAQTFAVSVDGQEVARIKPASTAYVLHTTNPFTVTATGQHLIELRGIDSSGGDHSAFLDRVSLSVVSYTAVTPRAVNARTGVEPAFLPEAIRLKAMESGRLRATLSAVNGRVLFSWSKPVHGGESATLPLPPALARGEYLFKWSLNGEAPSRRMFSR